MAESSDGEDPIDEDMIDAMRNIKDLSEFVNQLGAGRKSTGDGSTFGVCDVVGVSKGSDVERLLPTEMALLCDEDLSLELMKRITEEDAWIYEVEDKQSSAGDFILMVDRSGSMTHRLPFCGDRMQWARSVALSIIKNCLDEDRSVVLVLFAGTDDVDSMRIESKKDLKLAVKKLMEGARGGTYFPWCTGCSVGDRKERR